MMTIDFVNSPSGKQEVIQYSNVRYASGFSVIKVDWYVENIESTPHKERGGSAYVSNFIYYPKLSLLMLTLTLASFISLAFYAFGDIRAVHPFISLWGLVSFGGMYAVLVRAGKEIDAAKY